MRSAGRYLEAVRNISPTRWQPICAPWAAKSAPTLPWRTLACCRRRAQPFSMSRPANCFVWQVRNCRFLIDAAWRGFGTALVFSKSITRSRRRSPGRPKNALWPARCIWAERWTKLRLPNARWQRASLPRGRSCCSPSQRCSTRLARPMEGILPGPIAMCRAVRPST